jgi:hypothetical protein
MGAESNENGAATGDDHIDQLVTKPGENDVLCGRGGGTNNHCGNIKFRALVNEHKLRYLAASKVEKPKVAREVVKQWRSQDPPGRFLARKDDSRKGPGSVKAEGNIWSDVGDKKAREKASQCLRERTPDVIPFVREMQRQQDFLTGHGLRYVEQQMKNGSSPPPGGALSSSTASPAYHDSPRRSLGMDEPDVNSAFSVEHFAANGFTQSAPPAYGGGSRARAQTDPFEQMTQEEQWAMFQGIMADDSNQTSFFPDPQISAPNQPFDPDGLDMHNADGDELTLDEYTKSMEEFLQKNNLSNETDLPSDMQMRTKTLEDLKQDSWVKSFYSIDSKASSDTKTPRKSNGRKKRSTLDATIERSQQSNLAMANTGRSTRTELTAGTAMTNGTNLSKMSLLSGHFSAMSGVSMFSEMSEEDSRAAKMGMARGLNSNLSMMSELTDLSESLKSLDLATGQSKHHHSHHHHH